MKFRTFALFVSPSLVAMLVLIALPLLGVGWLSLWNSYNKVEFVEIETRSPVGVRKERRPRPVLDEDGRPVQVWEWYGARNYETVGPACARRRPRFGQP